MKTRALFNVGMSALALCGTILGGALVLDGVAAASTRSVTNSEKQAEQEAATARKALARGKYDEAVAHAEVAVGFGSRVVSYRLLLAQSYLKAGRFTSARQSFADVLELDPSNGGAALQFALAEIAEGNWDGARRTLDANASIIPASDRGLAVALAGDPAAAVEILMDAARAPDADAKTRQNLALALALAGRWQEAKTVIAVDVSEGEVDKRIMEWASFAHPTSASDQVAALLGVTPVQDSGQPVALALNPGGAATMASKDTAPVDTFMPGTPANAVSVAAEMGVPVTTPAMASTEPSVPQPSVPQPSVSEPSVMAVAAPASRVSFGPRVEMVQTLPARVAVAEVAPSATPGTIADPVNRAVFARPRPAVGAAEKPRVAAKGKFVVQLGAYDSAAVAKDAWSRISRRYADLGAYTPTGMPIKSGAGTFYRLSVGGLAQNDARALCRSYRAKGGACFVRAGAGDQAVDWAKSGGRRAR